MTPSVADATVSATGIERTQFENGLVVCSEFVPGVRSVAAAAFVRAGSVHERREQMGVSHLLEHLVFKGTAKRTAREIALALEARGGGLEAYTSREHTSFQAQVLERDLPLAVDVMRDLMFAPLLREEDLTMERQVIYDEIAQVEDTPDDLVFEEHNALLWGVHPYGFSILGTRDTLGALQAADLRVQHAATYQAGNTVFIAAGNIAHDDLVRLLTDAGWAQSAAAPVRPVPMPPLPATATSLHIARDSQQAHIVLGSTTIPMSDPSRPAYLVVDALLGGGMSSRLFQRVREELALAYSVFGFHALYSDVGVHGVYVGTAPENARRALSAVRDELQRLVNEGVGEDELAMGREQLIGQYLLSHESVGARMQRVATSELYGEPFRTVDEVIQRIECVTTADALAVARRWFTPERQTVVTLGPAAKG